MEVEDSELRGFLTDVGWYPIYLATLALIACRNADAGRARVLADELHGLPESRLVSITQTRLSTMMAHVAGSGSAEADLSQRIGEADRLVRDAVHPS